MKKITRKILLLLIATVMLFSVRIFAADEFKGIEKSAEFEKWENLSEEERKNAIQPAYNDLKIENSLKRSTYNKLRYVGDSQLENRYFLNNNVIKNQQQTALCWAFSFTSSLESTISKRYNKTSLEYSPIYTDYVVSRSFRKSIGDAANANIALASAISGYGAAYETDMPFSNYYNEENNSQESFYLSYNNVDLSNLEPKVKINKTTRFASIYKQYASDNSITYKDSSALIEYTENEVNAIRTQIKKHIKEHGAVMSYTYTGNANNDYNPETNAFYSNSNLSVDHAITIVGWDDNYSKTNFVDGNQPANDGAYIVLNSWGNEFGDNGYYYISYDDAYIEQEIQGIDDVQEYLEEEKDYDNLYQYDELGQSLSYYFLNNEKTHLMTEGYLANVFSRESTDKYEYITEVGIYVPITEGIEIYVDYLNNDMKDYELVASYTGTNALEPGYHSIKLASPLKIEGDSFAVIVKYIHAQGAEYALECNYNSSGLSDTENYFSTATANAGESYISNDGSTWTDINEYQIPISSTFTTYKDTNACIKAFTTTTDAPVTIPVTGVEITEKNITLDKGNTANIVATVKPENATNKNITWGSSDESVATVQNGVVTGVSEGTATITVTTEDGAKTDTCTVTVNDNNQEEVIPVTEVKFDMELAEGVSLVVNKGTTYPVTVTVLPENATNKNVTWSSSDENIAKVENGVVTGISEGTATITVTTEDGAKTASIPIKVVSNAVVPVESVSLSKQTLSLEVGDETNLVVSFNPSNASNKNVKWTSSNEKVATISDTGIIKALAEGKTTITVTSEDGNKSATCELTVVKKTNSDDDIYKSDGNSNTSNKTDTTTAKVELPNTGLKIMLIILVSGVLLIGTVAFIKYRKYIDVK